MHYRNTKWMLAVAAVALLIVGLRVAGTISQWPTKILLLWPIEAESRYTEELGYRYFAGQMDRSTASRFFRAALTGSVEFKQHPDSRLVTARVHLRSGLPRVGNWGDLWVIAWTISIDGEVAASGTVAKERIARVLVGNEGDLTLPAFCVPLGRHHLIACATIVLSGAKSTERVLLDIKAQWSIEGNTTIEINDVTAPPHNTTTNEVAAEGKAGA